MAERVLDASAVLAYLRREPGWDKVEQFLLAGKAMISTVNQAEIAGKLADKGMPETAVRSVLARLALEVVEFDTAQALACGLLRTATRNAGLSLGDRACLALGRLRGLPVVTADRAWEGLGLGVRVELLR